MTAAYQVVAECCHVTVESPFGKSVQLLLKGALVPADAPQLQRLVEDGFVAKVGKDETGGVDAAGIPAAAYDADVPAGLTSTPVVKSDEQVRADREAADKAKADDEVSRKRAEAQAKLPPVGELPDGRASQAVWVEYHVRDGGNYDDLAKQDKTELVSLAQQRSSTSNASSTTTAPTAPTSTTTAKPTPAKPSK